MIKKTIWYHRTSLERWETAVKEGVLWGERGLPSRCTYLAALIENAVGSADGVLLRVRYTPVTGADNFHQDAWQIRVYEPIPIEDVEVIETD